MVKIAGRPLLPAVSRRRAFFELLNVALFNLLHEGFSFEEVTVEFGGELPGNDEKLIVEDFGKGDGPARGNQVRAPLEDQAAVPEDEKCQGHDGGSERGSAGAKERGEALERNRKAENEKRGERDEKAVSIGRDAIPIGIASNENIKGQEGRKERGANARRATPKEKQTEDGEKENGSPSEQAVIRREKHAKECRRGPEPVAEGDVAGFEGVSVNDVTSKEDWQSRDEKH